MCTWWDQGDPCNNPDIKLACCADINLDDFEYPGVGVTCSPAPAVGFTIIPSLELPLAPISPGNAVPVPVPKI